MNANQVAIVLYNVLGFVALWGLAWCWRGYKVDKLRQDIFDLRAELFEFAVEGEIDFDDYFYRRLRTILNSMIRFAHQLSFVRLVTTVALEKWRPMLTAKASFLGELRQNEFCHPARPKLEEVHNRLMKLVRRYILTTSLAALPALLAYFAYSFIKQALSRRFDDIEYCKDRLETHVQLMEKQALETRELEVQRRPRPAIPVQA